MADKESKIKNCGKCNKQLKRVKRYYREGKYFCNKNCYKAFKGEQNKKEE